MVIKCVKLKKENKIFYASMIKISSRLIKSFFSSSKVFMDLEAQYGCHNYAPLEAVIERGEGIYMWDC